MSLWSYDIIRVDGMIKAYVRTQNEYTGSITGGIRTIYDDSNGKKYFRNDHQKIYCTQDVINLIQHEETVKKALDFYNRNHNTFTRG